MTATDGGDGSERWGGGRRRKREWRVSGNGRASSFLLLLQFGLVGRFRFESVPNRNLTTCFFPSQKENRNQSNRPKIFPQVGWVSFVGSNPNMLSPSRSYEWTKLESLAFYLRWSFNPKHPCHDGCMVKTRQCHLQTTFYLITRVYKNLGKIQGEVKALKNSEIHENLMRKDV